jgi:hypothetical protein
MIWLIVISFLLALFLWLLLGPIIIFLNTDTNSYYFVLPGIFRAVLVPSEELFHIRGWILFIPFKYDPFRKKKEAKTPKRQKHGQKRTPKKISGNIQLLVDAVRSFRIRKLLLDVDTDDVILNAWLVPVFTCINSENIRMRINFEGRASLLLDLRLRLGTLLWIFIRNKYKSFF